MASLFASQGRVEISCRTADGMTSLGSLVGREAIAEAVTRRMKPHGPGGWSHHTTHDHLVDIQGDAARLDAQFVVFDVRGPTSDARGSITPIEAGYYLLARRRTSDGWLIETNRIEHDLPPG